MVRNIVMFCQNQWKQSTKSGADSVLDDPMEPSIRQDPSTVPPEKLDILGVKSFSLIWNFWSVNFENEQC